MASELVMPCPEDCERAKRLKGCDTILRSPKADNSCWRCDGLGYVDHDGDPTTPTVRVR